MQIISESTRILDPQTNLLFSIAFIVVFIPMAWCLIDYAFERYATTKRNIGVALLFVCIIIGYVYMTHDSRVPVYKAVVQDVDRVTEENYVIVEHIEHDVYLLKKAPPKK